MIKEIKTSKVVNGVAELELGNGTKVTISQDLILELSRYAHIDDITMNSVLYAFLLHETEPNKFEL